MLVSVYRRSRSSDCDRTGSARVWARRYVVPILFASSTTAARLDSERPTASASPKARIRPTTPSSAAWRAANGSRSVSDRCRRYLPSSAPRPVAPTTTAKRMSASSQLLSRKNRRLLRGLDLELQAVERHNPDLGSGRYSFWRARLPQLAVYTDVALRLQRLDSLADGANEVLYACDDLHAAHPAVEVGDLEAKEGERSQPGHRTPRRGEQEEQQESEQEEHRPAPSSGRGRTAASS
jgi:hypothetical protein